MTVNPDERLRQALDDLRRQRAALSQAREKTRQRRTKVSSADQMVTVALDGNGELTSITFNTTKWRRLPPAELGAVLVQTINRARAENKEELVRAYAPFLPAGMRPGGLRDGRGRVDQMLDDAIRRATEVLDERPGAGTRPPGR
jgi:DNA-binding protein YbaB